MIRTHYSTQVTPEMNGTSVTICGWAHEIRDLGGITFLVVRDREGLVQVVFWGGNKELFKQIMEADGRDDDSFELCYGTETSKSGLGYYGYDNEPSYLGMDIASLLETKTLPELRLHFCGFIQHKFGIDIDPKQVELHYGQVGSG